MPSRGTIYDRNGNVLTSSVECRNIAVNPQLIEDVDKTVSALVKATGIDKKTCRDLVMSDGTWVYIKRQVDEDDAAALEKKNLPGVLFEQAMKRVYPYGNLASPGAWRGKRGQRRSYGPRKTVQQAFDRNQRFAGARAGKGR